MVFEPGIEIHGVVGGEIGDFKLAVWKPG